MVILDWSSDVCFSDLGGTTFATATTVVVDGAETVNITIAPNTSI